MIDRVRDAFKRITDIPSSGNGGPASGEDIEERIERKDETIEELRDEIDELEGRLDSGEEERARRLGQLEDQLQEAQQDKRELKQRMAEMESEQKEATMQVSAPDSEYLKERPVISARGRKLFGLFAEWINERDKIGIKAVDPHDPDKATKVGMADTLNDLVVDAKHLMENDVIVAKVDENMEAIEPYPPIGRVQELKQKYERAKDAKNRLSSENSTLIDQKAELKDQRDKAIMAMSRLRMKRAEDRSPADHLTAGVLQDREEMLYGEIESRSQQLKHSRSETSEVIEREAQHREEVMEDVGKPGMQQSFEEVTEATEMTMKQLERMLQGLPKRKRDEVLEAFVDNVTGEGESGDVEFEPEESES